MKRLVMDIDGTLTVPGTANYADAVPRQDGVDRLLWFKSQGFEIILQTSRNMRTYDCSVGKINAFTLPVVIEWLQRHGIPYDEIHVGKPWCGHNGFYVDDKAIRPSEFVSMPYEEIIALLDHEEAVSLNK